MLVRRLRLKVDGKSWILASLREAQEFQAKAAGDLSRALQDEIELRAEVAASPRAGDLRLLKALDQCRAAIHAAELAASRPRIDIAPAEGGAFLVTMEGVSSLAEVPALTLRTNAGRKHAMARIDRALAKVRELWT